MKTIGLATVKAFGMATVKTFGMALLGGLVLVLGLALAANALLWLFPWD